MSNSAIKLKLILFNYLLTYILIHLISHSLQLIKETIQIQEYRSLKTLTYIWNIENKGLRFFDPGCMSMVAYFYAYQFVESKYSNTRIQYPSFWNRESLWRRKSKQCSFQFLNVCFYNIQGIIIDAIYHLWSEDD